MRNGVAEFLKMPRDRVRVVWMEGPQGYGRTAADDAGFEAAYLAKEIGRPVRVQWMRQEETAWDTKGPAYAFKMRGGLDAQGNVVALHYDACAADHNHLGYNEHDTVLISQLMGMRKATPSPGPRVAAVGHVRDSESPADDASGAAADAVRDAASHRQPARPRWSAGDVCGSESFIDELAVAAKADPVAFRLKMLQAQHGRRQRLQARALDRVHQGGGGEVRLGPAPVTEGRVGSRRHRHRPRHRLCVSQPDRRRRDRRGRGQSQDRPHLGEAPGDRARLRAGDQSRRARRTCRVRHAALAQPRAATKRCSSTPRRSRAWTG